MQIYKSRLLKLLLGAVGLTLPFFQTQINQFWIKNYSPKRLGLAEGLAPDHLILALAGLREFLANILWFRGDTFFHEGNYDAMLPIIRLATLLDPHNIDIYSTGVWHMAYNFTDSDNRSDRKYLPTALAFGKEGVTHNPHSHELLFNLGLLWMKKIEDHPEKAVYWFKKAYLKPDILLSHKSMLAHAFVQNNEISNALSTFEDILKQVKSDPENLDFEETVENNIDNLLIRCSERGFFDSKAVLTPSIDPKLKIQIKVIEPKKIEIQGNINLPYQGIRLKLVLKEKAFPSSSFCGADWENIQSFSLEGMPGKTYLQDQLYVKNGHFKTILDLNKDPGIYPLQANDYLLEIFYDPRYAPAPIQNKIGMNGEGLKNGPTVSSQCLPNRKIIYAQCELNLDQISHENQWKNKTPTFILPKIKN